MSSEIPKKLWQKLITIAKLDGIITDDEQALLDNIEKNLREYYKSKKLEKEEGLSGLKVLESYLDIMHEAYATAHEDEVISEDEFQLLKELQSIVKEMF
ncbi:MAG: hypothetical protein IH840_00605 [Candidatus Heimdallarchaeota archaeon]|nr:hypothetical protein [Candidatus Heimdallarchaeota archaeon]